MKNLTLFERFGDTMPPGYAVTEEQRAEYVQIESNIGQASLSGFIEFGNEDYSLDPTLYS